MVGEMGQEWSGMMAETEAGTRVGTGNAAGGRATGNCAWELTRGR